MTSTTLAIGPIVVLVQTLRPAWDTRAIRPVIERLITDGHDLADITWAAIRTAQDVAMRQPASIAFTDSPHWRPTIRDRETQQERDARIQAQIDAREDRARGFDLTDAQRQRIADAKAAIRRTLAEGQHTQEQP